MAAAFYSSYSGLDGFHFPGASFSRKLLTVSKNTISRDTSRLSWVQKAMSVAKKKLSAGPVKAAAPVAGEDELEREAVEELLKEAKRGKTRAETMGPMGWIKCPLAGANKRFLLNTIKNTVSSQRQHREGSKEDTAASKVSPSQEKEDPKRHRSHPYKDSSHSRNRSSRSHSPSGRKSSKDKHDRKHRKQ